MWKARLAVSAAIVIWPAWGRFPGTLAQSVAPPIPQAAPAPEGLAPVLEEIARFLEQRATEGFSGVVVVFRDDKPVLERAFGHADRERLKPLRTDMVFDMGSITKCFTGAAVLRLRADGKLALSDTLAKYFSETPPDKSAVTIAQLLQHTSGLEQVFGADEDYVTDAWVVARCMESKLLSPPGTEHHYSDAGYSLLAMIIEKTSGQPFEMFVEERILRPAGLTRTGYVLPKWRPEDLACGFKSGEPWGSVKDYFGPDGPSWNVRGNGAMLSTPAELAHWWEAVLRGDVLPAEEMELLINAYSGKSAATGHHVLSCSGNNLIFSAFYRRWLDDPHGVSLVLFTNSSEWPYEREELLKPLITLAAKYVGPAPSANDSPESLTPQQKK